MCTSSSRSTRAAEILAAPGQQDLNVPFLAKP